MLAGLCLGERDQLLRVVRGQARARDDHVRIVDEQPDRREILHGIVRRLGLQAGRQREVGRREQQRVAIGCGLLHRLRADEARRAGLVLDHDRLAEELDILPATTRPT